MVYLGATKFKGLCTEKLVVRAMEHKFCCLVKSRIKISVLFDPVLLNYLTVLPLALNLRIFLKYLQDLENSCPIFRNLGKVYLFETKFEVHLDWEFGIQW